MFEGVSKVDAVASTVVSGAFGPLDDITDKDISFGPGNKLMGQINLSEHLFWRLFSGVAGCVLRRAFPICTAAHN